MNNTLIGIQDKNGNELYEGCRVKHRSIDGRWQEWTVEWSDYRKQYIGSNDDEIYDLGQELLTKSTLIHP